MTTLAPKMPTMKSAQAELHATLTARAKLTARLKDAESALAEALASRNAMVARMASGAAVTAGESRDAEQKTREAETERALILDALAIPDAAVAAAERKIMLLKRIEYQRQYIRAVEGRLALADEADRLGALLAEWLTAWAASEAEISASWANGLTGRGPLQHEVEAMRSRHVQACFLPLKMQEVVLATGSTYAASAAALTHAAWSQGAADAQRKIVDFESELSET